MLMSALVMLAIAAHIEIANASQNNGGGGLPGAQAKPANGP
jgi:hypothetical protein